ncbi:AlpA family transcriptional regulator [Streptomyces sp. ST2-7A]|uniref:helix-turn-helix transcriptional regulator n=1 Tax=Streptomyces sp. ST2-7A TaxID=2907214 RepID=UPI001F479582|nr:helix-turn-helix domain-containing protein [Streptomyces sp. ST2-7A]MCE7081279.1 helix-turn-helix domain-containing protein [Streptomyces sp. ST2-7A]
MGAKTPEPTPIHRLRRGLPDRYLTPADLASLLAVPVETVYAWRRKGTGPPGFRVGKHLRYDPGTVHTWIAERTAPRDAA